MNERIREIHGRFNREIATYELLCECARPGCSERVVVPARTYEAVRLEPGRFVVAAGHESGGGELVIGSLAGYEIVEEAVVAPPSVPAA